MPELVTDEMVSTFSVEGRWRDLRDRLEERYDHIDRTAVYLPSGARTTGDTSSDSRPYAGDSTSMVRS